jgi:hypothetical protein
MNRIGKPLGLCERPWDHLYKIHEGDGIEEV